MQTLRGEQSQDGFPASFLHLCKIPPLIKCLNFKHCLPLDLAKPELHSQHSQTTMTLPADRKPDEQKAKAEALKAQRAATAAAALFERQSTRETQRAAAKDAKIDKKNEEQYHRDHPTGYPIEEDYAEESP